MVGLHSLSSLINHVCILLRSGNNTFALPENNNNYLVFNFNCFDKFGCELVKNNYYFTIGDKYHHNRP